MSRIALVTPVWNDAARLEDFGFSLAEALADSGLDLVWIVSDDGSSVAEKQRLEMLIERFKERFANVALILSECRSRKGGAVYRAWDAHSDADLLAFVDGDGAIDALTTVNLLKRAASDSQMKAYVGVRTGKDGLPVKRSPLRRLSFELFRMVVRFLLSLRSADSQCGIKVVPGAAYQAIRARLKEEGFAFDIELLLALKEKAVEIQEVGIAWQEISGSKVNPLRDGWAMIEAVRRVRRRWRAGAYSS